MVSEAKLDFDLSSALHQTNDQRLHFMTSMHAPRISHKDT